MEIDTYKYMVWEKRSWSVESIFRCVQYINMPFGMGLTKRLHQCKCQHKMRKEGSETLLGKQSVSWVGLLWKGSKREARGRKEGNWLVGQSGPIDIGIGNCNQLDSYPGRINHLLSAGSGYFHSRVNFNIPKPWFDWLWIKGRKRCVDFISSFFYLPDPEIETSFVMRRIGPSCRLFKCVFSEQRRALLEKFNSQKCLLPRAAFSHQRVKLHHWLVW